MSSLFENIYAVLSKKEDKDRFESIFKAVVKK